MNARWRWWAVLVCLCAGLSISCSSQSEEPPAEGSNPAVAVSASSRSKDEPEQRIPRGKRSDQFANILLYTQHGEPVRFYDDLVKDQVVMINLMYTTCPTVCPATTANLAKVHKALGEWVGRDILMLSLSIDPEVDTPERLKRFWELFGSKPGWIFLTGDYDEIDRLRHELGVYDLDPVIDADKTQHSGIITFGNDRTDRWSALPALMHAEQMAETVVRATWDRQWQKRGRSFKQAGDGPKPHRGQGVVLEVHAERGQIVIKHEDIPELMMAMTMTFEVADRTMLEGLSPGQRVDFRVEHAEGRYRILAINRPGE